jgi:subtilisin family serine protease
MSFVLLFAMTHLTLLNANASVQEKNATYIIVLKDNVKNATLISHEFSSKYGIVIDNVYEDALKGFSAEISEDKLIEISNESDIESIEPDVATHALDLNADKQIGADEVWANDDTGKSAPVAILDTGIDTTHPEFAGRIIACHSEFSKANRCEDKNGHGTHVAGILGSAGIFDINSKGVAPSVSLYIDKVLNVNGSGSISKVIAGIDWSIRNHVKVISMSLGTGPISTTEPNCDHDFHGLTKAINNAVKDGITVVAAAGNDGGAGVDAPGCISNVIAVGATDSTNTLVGFSSRGEPMTDHGIVAPGIGIYSTWLNGGYQVLSGTSMATPQVSGVVSLMIVADPNLTPLEIKNILFDTACTSASNSSCPTGNVPNSEYGYGRVDAFSAYNKVISNSSISEP